MFLLRRAAVRALRATPSKPLFTGPRSISSFTPSALRTRPNQCSIISIQKRFASDEAAESTAKASAEDGYTPARSTIGEADPFSMAPDSYGTMPTEPAHHLDNTKSAVIPEKTLFVSNLLFEVTEDQLRGVFSQFGELEALYIVRDRRGLSKGFGYVNFKNVDDAQNAISNLDQQEFEGRRLFVKFHEPNTQRMTRNVMNFTSQPPNPTLFIGNISFEVSDKDLNDLFRTTYNVKEVRIAVDKRTGQPRGFAHAEFVDTASATKAKDELEGKMLYGRLLRIDYGRGSAGRREYRPRYSDQE